MSNVESASRPLGWEYDQFATELLEGLAAFAPAYQDFLKGAVDLAGALVEDPQVDVHERMDAGVASIDHLNRLFTPAVLEAAFGSTGQPGNAEQIHQLASGIVAVFSTQLQWARDCRSAVAPDPWPPVYAALANFAHQPLRQIQTFASDFRKRSTVVLDDVRAGRPPTEDLSFTLQITIGDDDMAAFTAALKDVPSTDTRPRRFWRR
jgi:hypothetical protein